MCAICVCENESKKISQTNLTDREHNLSGNANITFTDTVLFSSQLRQTVSNNSEHLGSLQALHLSPWGSSPGTGGPVLFPFLLRSCLNQADYHSSPRRDMRLGILSYSFTLIIGTEWQRGKSTDTYHQCSTKPSQCQKVNFPEVTGKIR